MPGSKTEQFIRYLFHLIEWNKAINLTAIVNPDEIIVKHFIDSLTALAATNFPEHSIVLDVGSGGGFPGIPLKIMRPDLQLVLIEPVKKKCSFLNSTIGLLRLPGISAFDGTIEQYAKPTAHHTINMIVLRALKFEEIRKHAPSLLTPNGKIVLYRTETANSHDLTSSFSVESETIFDLPQGAGKRVISVLSANIC